MIKKSIHCSEIYATVSLNSQRTSLRCSCVCLPIRRQDRDCYKPTNQTNLTTGRVATLRDGYQHDKLSHGEQQVVSK
jgi:hypothetical protein